MGSWCQRGAGLLEVLVALGLSSVGMIGLLSLQQQSLDAVKQASWYQTADGLSQSFLAAVRSNPSAWSTYLAQANSAPSAVSDNACREGGVCSAGQMAQADVVYLKALAARQLPQGRLGVYACGQDNRAFCVAVAWQGQVPQGCLTADAPKRRCFRTGITSW